MSDDREIRSKVIRLAATMPKGSQERRALLDVLADSGWGVVFTALDKAFPRWNPNKVTDWNKVYAQFRGSTNDPGAAAHHYSEYRAGRMTQDEAIKGLVREGVKAPRL